MYAQIEKPKENKSRAVANSVGQKKSNMMRSFGFVDNRPKAKKNEAIALQCVTSSVQKSTSATKQYNRTPTTIISEGVSKVPEGTLQLVDWGKVTGGGIVGVEGVIGGGISLITGNIPGQILNGIKIVRGIITTISGYIADIEWLKPLNSIFTECINVIRDSESIITIYAGAKGVADGLASGVFMLFRGIIKMLRSIVKHLQTCFKSDHDDEALNKQNIQEFTGLLHGVETGLMQMETLSHVLENIKDKPEIAALGLLKEIIVILKALRTKMDLDKADDMVLTHMVN